MLVMTKKTNLSDSVDYQNTGPKKNFLSVFTHALDPYFMLQINGRLIESDEMVFLCTYRSISLNIHIPLKYFFLFCYLEPA